MPLFEIHVSVQLDTPVDEIKWRWFCKKNHFHCIKVYNIKGIHAEQNMIAKWCDRDTISEAIEYAKLIGQKIREQGGFTVLREKVESMMLEKQNEDIKLNNNSSIYWEFHLKVQSKSYNDFERIHELFKNDKYVGLSMSAFLKQITQF